MTRTLDVSEYSVRAREEPNRKYAENVEHYRADGVLVLVRKALNALRLTDRAK